MPADTNRAASLAVLSASVTFGAFAMPIAMLGVMWPEVRDRFGQSVGTLGLVGLAYGLSRMSTATTGRRLVGLFGTGRAFVGALALLAASTVALAASQSWPGFIVAVIGVGLVSGMLDSIGAAFVTELSDVGSAGLIHGSYGIGATVGPLVVALAPNWRVAVLAGSIVASAALVLAVMVRSAWPVVVDVSGDANAFDRHQPLDDRAQRLVPVGPQRWLIAVSLGLFATLVAVEVTIGQWAHTFLTEQRDLGDSVAAVAVAGFWAGVTLGRLALARSTVRARAEQLGIRRLAGLATGLAFGFAVLPAAAAAAALGLLGLVMAPIIPTLFATTSQRIRHAEPARIAGWQLLAANAGAISVPATTGVVVDQWGSSVIAVIVVGVLGGLGLPLLFALGALTGQRQPAK